MALPIGVIDGRVRGTTRSPNQPLRPNGLARSPLSAQPFGINQVQQVQQPLPQNNRGGFKPTPQFMQQQAQTSVQQPIQEISPQFQQANQPQPQFGLAGGEQALQAGLTGGLSSLQSGTRSALDTLQFGGGLAGQQFDQGIQDLTRQNQAAQQQIQQGQSQALGFLNPFRQTGTQANQAQSALSGALGKDAQAQAFADFNDSPEQQFLREQGQLSIINQAAALGGLGGANVQKELTRFGTGLAAQDFQNRFDRLGDVAGRGFQAAGQSGSIASQGAAARANLSSSLGGQQLGARTNLGGLFGNLASQGAGFQQQAGQQAANLFGGAGSQLAGARIGAGQDIARGIQGTTQGLSQLAQQQGSGVSDIIGTGSANIANILSGAGQLDATQLTQLAQLLQGLSTGQGTQLSGLASQIGQAQAGGITGQAAGVRAGLGQAASALTGGLGASAGGGSNTDILTAALGGFF